MRNIPIMKWKINYFKIKIVPLSLSLDETMSLVMDKPKKGATVCEELALFNQSSVGYKIVLV